MTDQSSLALRKQMLEDRIRNISLDLGISEDKAFMHVAYAWLFNTSYDDPDYDTDLVDGSGDKQIDIIKIDESEGQAVIHLVQVKNTNRYEGTVVVKMRDGLSWVFKRPEGQYKALSNKDLVVKIGDIHEVLGRLTVRNVELKVHYVAKGDTSSLSPDFVQEVQNTENLYVSGRDFQQFEFKVWGIDELIERSYELEQQRRRIDVNLPIYRFPEVSSYLQYGTTSIESAVCTVEGTELAKIVEKNLEYIFEENVRTYLGDKKVNLDILRTCSNDAEAEYFWFYNNGITITCDSFHFNPYSKPPQIIIENIQIVNGCQTSMTLFEAYKQGKLSMKTKVLLKVFATKDAEFVDRITLTTNSQTAVSNRDLRSNDEFQRNLEKLFASRNYYYERKPRMFKDLPRSDKKRIISNEKVGQAHLAVVQKLPAVAMAQRSKIWTDPYYKKIFSSNVEELLLSYLIHAYCSEKRRQSINIGGLDQAVIKYGSFHTARIIGSLLLGEDWRKCSTQQMTQFIREIGDNETSLDEHYKKAQVILKDTVEALSGNDLSQVINIFKSGEIQQRLDNVLAASS